jgi:hypothetical protein
VLAEIVIGMGIRMYECLNAHPTCLMMSPDQGWVMGGGPGAHAHFTAVSSLPHLHACWPDLI